MSPRDEFGPLMALVRNSFTPTELEALLRCVQFSIEGGTLVVNKPYLRGLVAKLENLLATAGKNGGQ